MPVVRYIYDFFYINPIQLKALRPGIKLRAFGEVRFGKSGLEMIHPEYRILSDEVIIPVEKNLTPIYPTTEGLSQLFWRKVTDQALKLILQGGVLEDILPPAILQKFTFPTLSEALLFVHRPPVNAAMELLTEGKHISQKTISVRRVISAPLEFVAFKKYVSNPKSTDFFKKRKLRKKIS